MTEADEIERLLEDVANSEKEQRDQAAAYLHDELEALENQVYRYTSALQLGLSAAESNHEQLCEMLESFSETATAVGVALDDLDPEDPGGDS